MLRLQLAALLAFAWLGLLAATGRLRFLADEFPQRRRRLVAATLLIAILAVCVFYPALSADVGAEVDPAHLWFPALFLGHALLLGAVLGWWALRRDEPLRRLLLLDRLLIADVWHGIWLGSIGWAVTILATALAAAAAAAAGLLAPERPTIPELMLWFADLPVTRKLVIIGMAMTVEEAFFRGFLQPRMGWIPSSVLFALSHGSYGLPLMLVSVLVISLVIGWSLRQTGRLLPCIVAHGVFDAIQLLLVIPWAVKMVQQA